MKAITIQPDKSLLWTDVIAPTIGKSDVLIKVEYAAVNRADLMQVDGCYPPPAGCPDYPGLEVSGTIAAAGADAKKFKVGDKVCALLGGGGYAEYVSVHEQMVMPIPENVTMREAAAIPEAFATAYLNLAIEGGVKRGDTVLMHAGASGLASVVIPMAKSMGAYVVTTIIDENKRDTVAKLKPDLIINTAKEDIVEVLKKLETEGRPVNCAIDCLGGEVAGKCLPHLGYMAKWIMIATLAGDLTEVDMRKLYVRNVRLVGSTLRSKPESYKGIILSSLVDTLWDKVSAGEIRPTIFAELPITEAKKAHMLLAENKSAGKVVLKI